MPTEEPESVNELETSTASVMKGSVDEVENSAVSSGEGEHGAVSVDKVENSVEPLDELENSAVSSGEGENGAASVDEVENSVVSSGGGENGAVSVDNVENSVVSLDEMENSAVSSGEGENGAASVDEVENSVVPLDVLENSAVSSNDVENGTVSSNEAEASLISLDGVEDNVVEDVKESSNSDNSLADGQSELTEDNKDELISEAGALLSQGKRFLSGKDYFSAVKSMGDACDKLSKVHGEFSEKCVDAYFSYGCALLELAREEGEALGAESREIEEKNDSDLVGDDEKENGATEKPNVMTTKPIQEDVKETTLEDSIEINTSDVTDEDEEGGITTLQLAWEIFELAKCIFCQQKDDKKLTKVYMKLGEVSLECENYSTAISDFKQCLQLQESVSPPSYREIAESLIQLGTAYSLSNQYYEAVKHFTSAGVVLEKRIRLLSRLDEPEPEKAKIPSYSISNEIDEIRAILPEIKDKISEMEDIIRESMKTGTFTPNVSTSEKSSSRSGPSNVSFKWTPTKSPIRNISHLIKRKRKSFDNVSNETKRPRRSTTALRNVDKSPIACNN